MKKLGIKGFGAVEGLLILVIVGIIGGVGYYVYNNQKTDVTENKDEVATQTQQEPKAYERTTSTPADWKKSSNDKYKITYSYPKDWRVSESVVTKEDGGQNVYSENATETLVICYRSPDAQQWCPAQINISDQSFDESVIQIRKYYDDSAETNPYTETKLTIDGHEAVVFERKSTVKDQPGEKEYLVGANGYTYSLPIVHDAPLVEADGTQHLSVLESLQLFESVRIK